MGTGGTVSIVVVQLLLQQRSALSPSHVWTHWTFTLVDHPNREDMFCVWCIWVSEWILLCCHRWSCAPDRLRNKL